MTLQQNITDLKREIGTAQLLAVTKNQSPETIRKLISCGIKQVGENRLQEIQEKYDSALLERLKEMDVELHFIGKLQGNKVPKIVQCCDVIQSVDSLKIAKKIHHSALAIGKTMPIFLQLNLSGEEQKNGLRLREGELKKIIDQISPLDSLELRGFMCMGKSDDDKETRKLFRKCHELAKEFNLPELSMGMSNDYRIALEEGSTLVRLGRILYS